MFSETINKISDAAQGKRNLLEKGKSKYLFSSALAGMYVGFGILLIFTVGGLLSKAQSPSTKIVMGLSFAIALSLVLMAGSELFTGNNMIMSIGALQKRTSWKDAFKVWTYSYIGNLIGSVILAGIFVLSGLASDSTAEFMLKTSAAKMSAPFIQLFMRGILCNILVCLAVWCSFKLKEETAKIIMISLCLFAFITSGFEHSVANMTLLSVGLMIPHAAAVSLGGFVYNLVAVTLGNMLGGIFFVGFAYWFISKDK
ncbi:formate/nitrite transporter family protein [Clostridium sp.]|jgi:nitrite transporter|uniref:formate/nitrite transporter family protein n=1 Tax=Clostridium sp. TaxID=1506 RepID=UPI0039F6046D